MRVLLLLLMPAVLAGCAANRIEKPYIVETTTAPDGTVTRRETSAESITGGTVDALKTHPQQSK